MKFIKLYGVGYKVNYRENRHHFFKVNEINEHYAIIKVKYFYCNSFKEACEKYKELNIDTSYRIFDIYECSDKYNWFTKYDRVSEEIIEVEVSCNIEELREHMTCIDFKNWFNDKSI